MGALRKEKVEFFFLEPEPPREGMKVSLLRTVGPYQLLVFVCPLLVVSNEVNIEGR